MTTSQFVETRFSNAARQVLDGSGGGTICSFRWGERLSRRSPAKADPRERYLESGKAAPARQQPRPTKSCHDQGERNKAEGIGGRAGQDRETSMGVVLNHADDVLQLHLAERAPPFAMLVPNGQTPEMFALHQHHLIHRRPDAVFRFAVRCRGRIRHTLNIRRRTTIGSPDFAKDSTGLGLVVFPPMGCNRARLAAPFPRPSGRGVWRGQRPRLARRLAPLEFSNCTSTGLLPALPTAS